MATKPCNSGLHGQYAERRDLVALIEFEVGENSRRQGSGIMLLVNITNHILLTCRRKDMMFMSMSQYSSRKMKKSI